LGCKDQYQLLNFDKNIVLLNNIFKLLLYKLDKYEKDNDFDSNVGENKVFIEQYHSLLPKPKVLVVLENKHREYKLHFLKF